MIIKKKCWPEFFEKIKSGEKKFEVRMADFECIPGDTLLLEEWDPETQQYTGRKLSRKITYVVRTKDLTFWPSAEIEQYGYQILSLEENKDPLNNELVMDMWRTGPPPATGQFQRYPSRFWFNFKKRYPIEDKKVLHMFSGSMDWGDTTDIRPETGAQIVAPYDELPIPDETYDIVAADPAYNKGFASEWITHAKHLPKPKRILIEAARVTKPGGIIAILHIITIPQYPKTFKDLGRPGVRCIGRHGILCGSNNAIRLLNVFRKL